MGDTVIWALRNSRHGRLKYDPYWFESKTNLKNLAKNMQSTELKKLHGIFTPGQINVITEAMKTLNADDRADSLQSSKTSETLETDEASSFANFCSSSLKLSILKEKQMPSEKSINLGGAMSEENDLKRAEISEYESKYIKVQKKWDDIMHESVSECLRRIREQRIKHNKNFKCEDKRKSSTENLAINQSENFIAVSSENQPIPVPQLSTSSDYGAKLLQVLDEKLSKNMNNFQEILSPDQISILTEAWNIVNNAEFNQSSKLSDSFAPEESVSNFSKLSRDVIESPEKIPVYLKNEQKFDIISPNQVFSNNNQIFGRILEDSKPQSPNFDNKIGPSTAANVDLMKISAKQDSSFKTTEIAAKNEKVEAKISEFALPPRFKDSVTREGYEEYLRLKIFLAERQEYLKSFINDSSMKILRGEITTAVTSVFNMMSGVNFRENLNKLRLLLRGETVVFLRTNRVSLKKHSKAPTFCMDLICKRLISALEKNLNESPMALFYSAAVAVALCAEFGELKPYMLAHLYKKCPFLVPFYMTMKDSGSSAEEQVLSPIIELDENGKPIIQDSTLKPIMACARFFAAVLVTQLPPIGRPGAGFRLTPTRPSGAEQESANHPFGLKMAWNLVASLTQLTPRYQITAIILDEIFKIAGYSLMVKYGRQFKRLINLMDKKLLPKIAASSSGFSAGAAFVDLKRILESRRFDDQSANLSARIWSTSAPQSHF